MIYRKELENLNCYKPGKPIEEVKRTLGLEEVYKLASNEIPFIPVHINKVIQKELKSINRYPDAGCFYLRKLLSEKLDVNTEQIVFGNGSDELIALSLRAIINKGDEVIVSYPTFLIYEIQAKIHSAKIIRVPFKEFRYSLTEILKNISNKTKIIFIANPDNPTGTYLTQKEVEAFMIKVPDNVLVFFDEAYFEFAPSDYPDTLKLLKKKKNIFVSRTFSKAYGLAGIRIGYGVGSKELANVMNKIREPFNVNRLAQAGAIAALENDIFLKKVLNYVQKEKFYLYKEFNKLGIQFVKSATNFIMVDFNQDTSNLNDYLLKKGIIIRELKGWGMNNFFRVSIGKHKENKYFIHCLKKYMGLDK